MNRKLLLLSATALLSVGLASCGQPQPSTSSGGGGGGGDISSLSGGGDSGEVSTVDDSGEEDTEEGEGIDFHGIVRVYYHNDANNYASKRIWAWNTGVDGDEYPFANQTSPDSYGVYADFDLSKGAWAKSVSTTFSFIIKDAGTWAGQSTDTVCHFSDFMSNYDEATNMLTIYACDGEGSDIDTFAVREDALGDRIATAYFSNWKTLHIEGAGVSEGRKAEDVGRIDSYELYAYDAAYAAMTIEEKAAAKASYKIGQGTPNKNSVDITLEKEVEPYKAYTIEARMSLDTSRLKSKTASFARLYDTAEFVEKYTYTGDDLGVTVDSSGATFKVWAPTSSRVQVKIYATGTPGDLHDEFQPSSNWGGAYDLEYGQYGVWQGKVTDYSFLADSQAGDPYFYTYIVTNSSGVVETIDPYAHAAGINGVRGAVVDFASLPKPKNWDDIASGKLLTDIERPNEISVYEAHIRDLTADKSWNGTERPGTYKAFIEEGTTYSQGSAVVKTGFDHIKEMKMKAIQLLPVFDGDNDERWRDENGKLITERENFGNEKIAPAYNWGYNPLNYNCVEGAYSSNPFDPMARINEFRELVSKFADIDMRVIMDVVYNHFASINGNPLQKVVPGYFLRTMDDGSYYDGTGCGNVTATERAMFRKFVVDSCKFWATEYKIKGFRFDLMGCMDTKTMREVKDTLYAIDPDIVVYGEGWAGLGDGGFYTCVNSKEAYKTLTRASLSGVYHHLGDKGKGSVGCFSNGFRNGLKGDTANDIYPDWGFISKGPNDLNDDVKKKVAEGLLGANEWGYEDNCYYKDKTDKDGDYHGYNCEQTVNYAACHDNYGLYDQLAYAIGSQTKADVGNYKEAITASVSCQTASLLNQGIAFLQGGDEIFRQKVMKPGDPMWDKMEASQKGRSEGHDWLEGDGIKMESGNYLVRNAYQYGDDVNAFRYDRKITYKSYFDQIVEASECRNEQMKNIFGRPYAEIADRKLNNVFDSSYDGDKYPKNPMIADYLQGKKDKANYYLVLGGRSNTEWCDLDCGNCGIEVLYSSTGVHQKGQKFSITNGKLGAGKYELLLVKATPSSN